MKDKETKEFLDKLSIRISILEKNNTIICGTLSMIQDALQYQQEMINALSKLHRNDNI